MPTLGRKIKNAFPSATVTIVYGSTEAEPISTVKLPHHLDSYPGMEGLLVGRIHPDTEVSFKDLNHLPSSYFGHRIGEIQVSGPNVMSSSKGATLKHSTGDSGYFNHKEELMLTGPVDALFEHRGICWSPFDFDVFCSGLHGVQRAAICKKDGKVHAVILTEKMAKRAELRDQITLSKFPVDIVHFDVRLPFDKRHGGKILYAELSEIL